MKYLEPWELKYLENVPYADAIPWTDEGAWERYPNLRWVYNKQILSAYTNHLAHELSLELPRVSEYPVIVKPKTNLMGMGKGAKVCRSEYELPSERQGLIWQKYLTGLHTTTDYVLEYGRVITSFSFIGARDKNDSFILFASTPLSHSLPLRLLKDLESYRGVLNAEFIGGQLIEAHLRPSVQFFDISGGLLPQLGRWATQGILHLPKYEMTYSRVYRRKKDAILSCRTIPNVPIGVRSYQLCWEEGERLSKYAQDEHSFRVLVVNGTDFGKVSSYGKEVMACITDECHSSLDNDSSIY